jgi:hypothetical protein
LIRESGAMTSSIFEAPIPDEGEWRYRTKSPLRAVGSSKFLKQIPKANSPAVRSEVPVRLTGDNVSFAFAFRMRDYETSDMLHVGIWNVVVGCAKTASSTSACAVQWKRPQVTIRSSTLVTFHIRQSNLAGILYMSLAVPT